MYYNINKMALFFLSSLLSFFFLLLFRLRILIRLFFSFSFSRPKVFWFVALFIFLIFLITFPYFCYPSPGVLYFYSVDSRVFQANISKHFFLLLILPRFLSKLFFASSLFLLISEFCPLKCYYLSSPLTILFLSFPFFPNFPQL